MIRRLFRRAAIPAALTAMAVHVASCTEPVSPEVGDPAGILVVSGDGQAATVGQAVPRPLVIRVVDALHRPVPGATVDFAATGGGNVGRATAITRWDGTAETRWTLGTSTAEPQRVRAAIGPGRVSRVVFTATPSAAAPAQVVAVSGDGQRRPAGVRLRDSLSTRVVDVYDNPVPGVRVTWTTTGGGQLTPVVSVTNESGVASAAWTLGSSLGGQTASATFHGTAPAATFSAQATPGPLISGLTPNPVVPGATAVITGTNFGDWPDEISVTFNYSPAPVVHADSAQVQVVVPCQPTGPVHVTLRANGAEARVNHDLAVEDPLMLAVGETALMPPGPVCRELVGGRHLLAVVHGALGSGPVAFRLRGSAAWVPAGASYAMPGGIAPDDRHGDASRWRKVSLPDGSRVRAHARVLEQNARTVERLGRPPNPHPSPVSGLAPQAAHTSNSAVNSTVDIKIPDAIGNLCTVRTKIRARVVYTGSRTTILEDVAAPLAGRMDSAYRTLGEEFDGVQWGILSTHFGNPLAYDAQTDRNGRIFMVFSHIVNDLDYGVAFTSSGDFYPTTSCAASNGAEVFYGMVPTESGVGYGDGTTNNVENWLRAMRSIVIHEVKHITAFAEKLARNGSAAPMLEELWLEEGTAVIAEELFARTVYGYGRHGNTTFQESLFCETRPDPTVHPRQCWDKPAIMYGYFGLLHDYLSSMTALSPLGPAPGSAEVSYYGSAWSLLRWAADHFASDEASFFRALIQERSLRGITNLEARTGRTFADLIADWAIASAVDDHPHLHGLQAIHGITSWNTRDIFSRLHTEAPDRFASAFPVIPHSLGHEAFDVLVEELRAGSAALFELPNAFDGARLVNLLDPAAGAAGSDVRLKVVRIQ